MKKLVFIWIVSFILLFFFNISNVFAAKNPGDGCNPNAISPECGAGLSCDPDKKVCVTGISIAQPKQGFADLGQAIGNFFTIALAVAIVLVLIMLILGGYEWITSGGDKEAVAKARNRIINALIGLVVLAVAFALARLAGQITGFPNIFNLVLPTPNPQP